MRHIHIELPADQYPNNTLSAKSVTASVVVSQICKVSFTPNALCSYVKRAMHGTRMLSWQELRETYGRELVNLRNEGRWLFLNTLFSVSEAVMYMQVRFTLHVKCGWLMLL